MDKRNLYDSFDHLDQDLKRMTSQVSEIKSTLVEIVEANARLEVENRHLRDRLIELENKNRAEAGNKQELSKARMNLEKLYETGFHVCNVYYGSRRENDEECAFCLDVIYGERK